MTWLSIYAHPGLLLVAVIPVALLAMYALGQQRRRQRLRRFVGSDVGQGLSRDRLRWLRHLPIVVSVVAMISLTVAMAGPTRDIQIPGNRAVIMLVIDASQSMGSTDVDPDRLTVAKNSAKRFADELTPGVNLGVVTFAANAELLVSPTPDHSATVSALDNVRTDDGTATGEGIFAALQAIQTVAGVLDDGDDTPVPARIVLLSDGAENRPTNPDNPTGAYTAARSAKSQGVQISTVALGTQGGYVALGDQRVPVPVDDSMMKQIAGLSGGQTYDAADVDGLDRSYAAVAQQIGYQTERGPDGALWLRLGVALFVIAVLSSVLINRRVPV